MNKQVTSPKVRIIALLPRSAYKPLVKVEPSVILRDRARGIDTREKVTRRGVRAYRQPISLWINKATLLAICPRRRSQILDVCTCVSTTRIEDK